MHRWPFAPVVLLALGMASPAIAQDAHVGTWTLNVAKSKSDTPAPRSGTRTYAMFGDGLKATIEMVSTDGTRSTTTYSAHFDGKDAPITGFPAFDTIALKRIDASTFEATLKKAGKVVATVRNVVSKDGKTMIATSKGTNASGQPATDVLVFEKR